MKGRCKMQKSKAQNDLYKAAIGVAFRLPIGTVFQFNNLSKCVNHQCNTTDQQEAARRFSHLVKHGDVPFIIVDFSYPLTYMRVKGGNN